MYIDKLYKTEKKIILLEIIAVSIAFIYLFIFSFPEQIYPISGMAIVENDFIFQIKNAEKIIVSNNPEFSYSLLLEEGSEFTLAPGEYYWKIVGRFRESSVKSFQIKEVVGLDLYEYSDEKNKIKNTGTVKINVLKNNILVGVLNPGESIIFEKDNSTYLGGKYE